MKEQHTSLSMAFSIPKLSNLVQRNHPNPHSPWLDGHISIVGSTNLFKVLLQSSQCRATLASKNDCRYMQEIVFDHSPAIHNLLASQFIDHKLVGWDTLFPHLTRPIGISRVSTEYLTSSCDASLPSNIMALPITSELIQLNVF